MADETSSATRGPQQASRIARDLREYARAGTEPALASKLLAAAAELDALVTHGSQTRPAGSD